MVEHKDVMIAVLGAGATVMGFGLVLFGIIVTIGVAGGLLPKFLEFKPRDAKAQQNIDAARLSFLVTLVGGTLLPSIFAGISIVASLSWLSINIGHQGSDDNLYQQAIFWFKFSLAGLAYDGWLFGSIFIFRTVSAAAAAPPPADTKRVNLGPAKR